LGLTENPSIIGGAVTTSLPPYLIAFGSSEAIDPQTPQNPDQPQQNPDSKAINNLPRHHKQIINFKDDRRLTTNSLTSLQNCEIGDDEGFYGCDGILVLGVD
jgi:hypothetical protein